MKNLKKPPALPPKRPPKKKVVRPTTPEPPKEDPPEEPLPQSPRLLILPEEAGIPHQENAPMNMPMPMRLPEEPPVEPNPIELANLYCPPDPDTPYNYEILPREEDDYIAPLEPVHLHLPLEPEPPSQPDRMVKVSTEQFRSEKAEECEPIGRIIEPNHDDETVLDYPI